MGDIVMPKDGYKLHLASTTDFLVVPLAADVTTANVQDKRCIFL
ncbi:MAG: hypothetical protein ABJB73_06820 [Candidatus Nitrosocosmicus sp.]